jgi:hypothetical protein
MHRFRNRSFVLGAILSVASAHAQSRGPTIGDLVVHGAASPPRVDFTLSWPNAWHNERNHDAAWVVLRGTDATAATLLVAECGHDAYGSDVAATVVPSDDRRGVFVAPAAAHRGDVSWRISVALQDAPPDDVQAWSVGMVYIPAGAFELGDDDPLAQRFGAFHRVGDDGGAAAAPFAVESEAAIEVAQRAGALWYARDRSGYHGDQQGPIPAAWPKGTRAFYVMKHELTQGEYAAFLNALPEEWQRLRAPVGLRGEETSTCSIARDGDRFAAGAPERPCNFVSWDDTCALYDWLALRPLTEFEFEKAARGPRRPVAFDYPWGTASVEALARNVERNRDLTRADVASEGSLTDATRAELGASHYWVFDLGGSVWERVISAGHAAGRAFTGSHGDGARAEGRATNPDWPATAANGELAPGVGFRGGAEYFAPRRADNPTNPQSPVAVRTYGGWGGAERYKTYSARACRTAAEPASTRAPTAAEAAALAAELLERRERDQAVRTRDLGSLEPAARARAFDEATAVDEANTARMQEIVRTFGWPTHAMVGAAASDAAFLLVQHADRQPEFQARCLPILRLAAARGEASKSGLAYLTDRVRVKQGRPQLYGTQYHAATGDHRKTRYLPPVVEDPDDLDTRRSAMDLGPWADYEARMAQLHGRDPVDGPRAWNGKLPAAADRP